MLTTEDHLAIRELYARYNHAIHRGDGQAWAACFTRDGRFSNRARVVEGRTALADYAASWSADGRSRYWIDNLVLEPTDAGANGTCYLLLLTIGRDGAPPSVELTGIYNDSLVNSHGEWLFAARYIARDE